MAERGLTVIWFPVIMPNPKIKSILPSRHAIQYLPSGILTFIGSVRAFSTTIVFNHLSPQGLLFVEVGNSEVYVEKAFPYLPFTWLEFSEGAGGVFMLRREDLL